MRYQRHLVAAAVAVGGLVLFTYAVHRVGPGEIASGIERVGWGLLPILVLAGARFLLRAQCWRLCTPPASRFSFPRAFTAFLAGDAVGNLTPLGMAASEPTKVFLARRHLATRESIASLAVDNLIYAASVATVVALGVIVVLATVALPFGWRELGVAALLLMFGGALAALRVLKGTWSEAAGPRPPWRARLSALRQSVLEFSAGNPRRLGAVYGLHLTFHALAVFEVYLTLRWLLGDDAVTLAQAVVFEALNRVVTVVFKFVPFRMGVDEAFSGGLASILSVEPAAGVTLAVVRKVRNLFWTGAGLLLIAGPGRAGRATGRRENESVRQI